MKNHFLLRMFLIVLLSGVTLISFIGCSKNVDRHLNGQWIGKDGISGGEVKLNFNSGNYEAYFNETPSAKGTYTTSNGIITFNKTHQYIKPQGLDGKLYSKDELETALKNGVKTPWTVESFQLSSPKEYTLSGNILTINEKDGTTSYYTKVAGNKESKSVALAKNSGSASALVGRWSLVQGPTYENPEEMELLSDGTGISDGYGGWTWKIEKNRFYLYHSSGSIRYNTAAWDYKVSGSTLTLTADDGTILKYQKKWTKV